MKLGGDSRRFAAWWSRYVGSVAFIVLILLAAIGFARIENARYEGCQDGNLLRAGLRENEEVSIKTTETTDLEAIFPGVPPNVLEELSLESLARAHYNINIRYADRTCGQKIDLPLTGGAIVLPP